MFHFTQYVQTEFKFVQASESIQVELLVQVFPHYNTNNQSLITQKILSQIVSFFKTCVQIVPPNMPQHTNKAVSTVGGVRYNENTPHTAVTGLDICSQETFY